MKSPSGSGYTRAAPGPTDAGPAAGAAGEFHAPKVASVSSGVYAWNEVPPPKAKIRVRVATIETPLPSSTGKAASVFQSPVDVLKRKNPRLPAGLAPVVM